MTSLPTLSTVRGRARSLGCLISIGMVLSILACLYFYYSYINSHPNFDIPLPERPSHSSPSFATTGSGSAGTSGTDVEDLLYPSSGGPDRNNITLSHLPPLYSDHLPTLAESFKALHKPRYGLLAHRLETFLHRPILSHEEGKEINQRHCPSDLAGRLTPLDVIDNEMKWWTEVGVEDIVKWRGRIVAALASWVRRGGMSKMGRGRGIVISGGNKDTTQRVLFLLRRLKGLQVKLPIELFHFPGEMKDRTVIAEMESLGATIREIQGLSKVRGAWKDFQIKGLAILHSSFQEVLYLDSDNIPLRDPSHLFNTPSYLDRGHRAVFWPDLYRDQPFNAIWRIVGDPCDLDHWTFESGQIVIDKSGNNGLNLAALVIASFMQREREFWFHMTGGDKDTFRWALRILDLGWTDSPRWMSSLGILDGGDGEDKRFCGHSIIQYDLVKPLGADREPPLFIHSNLLKHLERGWEIDRGELFTHVKRATNDTYSSQALNHATMRVYMSPRRGMCVDLWVDEEFRGYKALSEGEKEGLKVKMTSLDMLCDAEGGELLRSFEDLFWDEGGKVGGW